MLNKSKAVTFLFLSVLFVAVVLLGWMIFGSSDQRESEAPLLAELGSASLEAEAVSPQSGQPSVASTSSGTTPSLVPARPSREPQGEWATRVPDVAEYVAAIPSAQVAVWQEFQKKYPQVDPTQTQDFHASVLKERQAYGNELTDQSAAQYSAWLTRIEAMRAALVVARGSHSRLEISGIDENGRGFALAGFEGVNPVYIFTQNVQAAISTNANLLRAKAAFDPFVGDTINGDGLYVSVTELHTIFEHAEFQLPNNGGSRIILRQTGTDDYHATHCAGTIGAWGYDASLIGMAPRVWLRSLIWQSAGLSGITSYGMRYPGESLDGTTTNPRNGKRQVRSAIGSTSLGATDSNTNRCVYTPTSATWDQTIWDYPYDNEFFAAGNDGGSSATLCIDQQTAKNITTIGNVGDVTRDTMGNFTGGGNIVNGSSRGPTFDGRVKPDLCGNGYNLKSTTLTGNSTLTGTSMATPNVAGTTALLVDYYSKCYPGHFLRSSSLRALLINTADDMGTAGPDYNYGWGVVNVQKAAGIVKRYADSPASRVVVEDLISSNGTYTATYHYDGSGPIRATLAWIDPAGTGQYAWNADHSAALVNNLNLRLVSQGGTTYYPYVMPFVTGNGTTAAFDASLYLTPAKTGDNTTDNVEQVYVASPPAGNYTLQVTIGNPGGTLSGGSQKFSLAVTGMAQAAPVASAISSVSPAAGDGTDNFQFIVNGSGFLLGSDVILRRDGFADAEAYGEEITGGQIACRADTSGLSKGRWDVVVRSPDGTETVLPAAFFLPVRVTLYSNDFTSATGLTLDSGWAVGVPNYTSGGPSVAFSGPNILAYNLSGNYTDNMNAPKYARTATINCTTSSKTQLSFRRWLGVESATWDHATVQVSNNGSTWTTVWENPTSTLKDTDWVAQNYDISAVADGQPTVSIRWSMGTTDSSGNYCGWNIDDVEVQGNKSSLPPAFTTHPPSSIMTVGVPFFYSIATEDSDSALSGISLTASGLPTWMTFTNTGNGTATLTGTPDALGHATVTLSVTDGDYTTKQTLPIFVVPVGGNVAPMVLESTLPEAYVGMPFAAEVYATDSDGPSLTLSTGPRPAWLGFTDNGDGSATLTGTPSDGTEGEFPIVVTATDGIAKTSRTFLLTVINSANSIVTVAATDATAAEAGADIGSFTLSRVGGDTGVALTVSYVMSGTATIGSDYSSLFGAVTFAAGSTSTSVTITPTDDSQYEGPETVVLTLSEGVGYFVGSPDSASITLSDNDKPTVSVAATATALAEGTTGTLTFSRTGPTDLDSLVITYTLGGTAMAGVDFSSLSGSVTIPSGQTSTTLDIPVIQDALTEAPETCVVTISANAGYIVAASPGNAVTLSLQDDAEQPILTIAASDNESSELASYKGNGNFAITRAGALTNALTVSLVAGGTATSGSDYTALPTAVTIPAGQSSVTIPLIVLDDTEIEPDETVTLTLQSGTGFTVGTSSNATANVYDDEPTQVRVELNDWKCSEGSTADAGSFTLRRLGTRSVAIAVSYTVSGTATNDTDYTLLSGNVTINANGGAVTITVTPKNDALVEGTETVILTAIAGTGYTVATPDSATLEVRDDETVDVSVTVQDATCKEQATPDTGTFRITRAPTSASAVVVNYTITGTATSGTDYSSLNGTLTIPANSASADVIVTPINDALGEGTESVILALAFNGSAYDLGDNRLQTLWIQDDDGPSISANATDATAAEADGGVTDPGQFTISITSAQVSDITVPYTIAGSALNGVDYLPLAGSLVIPAGETSVTLTVVPVDDDIGEAAESVTLTLGQVPGCNLLTTGALTVNIAASDVPEANIVTVDASAAENPLDTARFVVTLSKVPTAATTIAYTASGTATWGADYTALGVISVSAGNNTATVTLTPVNDTLAEGPETVTLTLAGSPNFAIGANASATATITDDESDGTQRIVVSPTSVNVLEGATATFAVSLAEAPTSDVAVAVAFSAGGDADLSVQSGSSLTFTPINWNIAQIVTLAAAPDVDALNGTATCLVTAPLVVSASVTVTEIDTGNPPTIVITSPAMGQMALPDGTDSLILTAVATGSLGAPTVTWSQVSGPSTAAFANANAASTSATFPSVGTYLLRATASDGSQTTSADLTVFVGGTALGYTGGDIGAIGLGGRFSTTRTAFSLTGEGPDITSTTDKCYFLGVPMSGNFSVSARVVSQTNTNATAKAGLMVRQNTKTGAQEASILLTPTSGVSFQYRSVLNGSTSSTSAAGPTAPYWVKITRNGNTFSGWSSPNGTTWSQVGANLTLTLADPVMLGMAVSSNSAGNYTTAVFDNLSGLPAQNAAPQVNPGNAPVAQTGTAVALAGIASDDALPSGSSLVTTWSKVSGPGDAAFGNANVAATSVTFSAPGDYVFRLSASDGSATVFEDLAINVTGSAYDSWLGGYPGASAGEDLDHDGLPNVLEFALGGDPTLGDPSISPLASRTSVGDETYLALSFRRARADVVYTVEGSANLSTWTEIPFTPGSLGAIQTVTDTVPVNALNTKRFLRLKVALPGG